VKVGPPVAPPPTIVRTASNEGLIIGVDAFTDRVAESIQVRGSGAKAGNSDLPFADDDDILEVADNKFFTTDELSAWSTDELAVADAKLRLRKRKERPERPITVPKVEAPPPPDRRRFRYYIARPFNGASVTTAPAARSSRRFTERTALHDVESVPFHHWPELITAVVGIIAALWLISSF
jgi:hypothetical protein